jgi:peptidyl-tRNA hydrolase, PTH1 family
MGLFSNDKFGPRMQLGKVMTDTFSVGEHATFLVVGLGNPGKDFEKNRHNVGYLMLDKLAEKYDSNWTKDSKKKVEISQYDNGMSKIILIKPTTFMNLSGEAVQAVQNYYKIPTENVIVVSDDIDLDYGKIRIRKGGGSGGHNGLSDVTNKIGDDYWRIRIGCKNELRDRIDAADFVLSNFTKEEQEELSSLAFREVFTQVSAICLGHGRDDTIIFKLQIQ